ncbi:MAG: hypothetical protein Q8R39_00845 [bacterium]|nr:hypothetical protein [bacterium]MDZ4285069.1 hypothetical protein [Patescibacteria group bacterium]
MTEVAFLIELVADADVAMWEHVLCELEVLLPGTEPIPCKFRASRGMFITGHCSKEAYEQAFGAQVEDRTKTSDHLNSSSQTTEGWAEVIPARIPDNLAAHVQSITLDDRAFRTLAQ